MDYKQRVRIGIEKAITKIGSQEKLANTMNHYNVVHSCTGKEFSQSGLSTYLKRGELPVAWVLVIEAVAGVDRSELHRLCMR